jgi:hypothetical protein
MAALDASAGPGFFASLGSNQVLQGRVEASAVAEKSSVRA